MGKWGEKLVQVWRGYDRSWSTELRASVRSTQEAVDWTFFRAFMVLSTPLYLAIAIGVVTTLHRPQAMMSATAWTGSAVVSLIFAIASALCKKPSRLLMFWGCMLSCWVAQATWGHIVFFSSENLQLLKIDHYGFGAIFGNIGIYSALSAFILGFAAFPAIVSHSLVSTILWLNLDALDFGLFCLASSICNIIVFLFFLFMRVMIANLIRVYLEAFALREQNQKLKLTAVQTDIELARRLHESLMPPPNKLQTGRYTLSFFHQPMGVLGGDWYAYRELSDGSIVIAVGDVTGKGVGAAMVVQSVQTLWADALTSSTFDAASWLQCVHETLQKLGERHTLSLSLGLVILRHHSIDYYSAGHTPLINIAMNAEGQKVSQVYGVGHLLGVSSASREIKPVSILLNSNQPQIILLGTDGVIGPNLRCSQKSLTKFASDFLQRGLKALPAATDDQILVQILVEPKATSINSVHSKPA